MGDLPADRLKIARPFTISSVDFAGPFMIRCTNHRSAKHLKCYAAFFVCFITRVVHIKPVGDLPIDAFVEAFTRFIARRGIPNTMWLDNATNFVGTKNEFEKNHASMNIQWKFIPPHSPHHRGVWESAVKAGKKHLLAASQGTVLAEEQFKTTLTTIEAIMNSRPLYWHRGLTNPDIINVITPGHFLVGSDLLKSSAPDENDITLAERLHFQKQIINSFWSAWSKNYLSLLQSRTKWKSSSPNLRIGDVVIIKEPNSSPCTWPLALIVDGKPDSKGHLWIVTKGSEYQRSIQQLVKLPIEHESSSASTSNVPAAKS